MEDESEEESMFTRLMSDKENEANEYAKSHFSTIKHHIHFTLQKKAYFKCAYQCYELTNNKEEVDECVEYCSVPVLKAHYLAEDEIAQFQDRLTESMKICQDKFEVTKNLQKDKIVAINELGSCVDQSIKESVETLPHVVDRLKRFLSVD